MAFSPSGQSAEFHYLIEFVLDSTTLRYADEGISLQTGRLTGAYYEGRLPQSGSLSRSLGTFLEPKETVSTFDVVLDNRDGVIQNLIQTNTFANRRVRVYLGQGSVKSNYSEVFTGFVAHPNGIRWDEDQAQFTVVDQRLKHRKSLPSGTYTIAAYPNLESKYINSKIPIIYGDWGIATGAGMTIPAACISMTAAKKRFKVADHGIKGIQRVLKNAVVLTQGIGGQVINISLSAGTFQITLGVGYSATTDVISCNLAGLKSANGTLLTRPADVLRSLFTTWMGLTSTDIDVTAMNTMNAVTDADGITVRRYINEETSTETLVQELLSESVTDMRFVGGKYSPKYRGLVLDSGRISFRDVDILLSDEATEKADFEAENDPDRYYANKITARYQYDPINVRYNGFYSRQVTLAVTNVSSVVERVIEYNWRYADDEVQSQVNRELIQYTTEPINIRFLAGPRALLKNLADQIDLTYNVFSAAPIQIRRMDTNLGDMTTRISGYSLLDFKMGRWTDDSAVAWSSANTQQKASQGFWALDSGYIAFGDVSSLNLTKWF